MVIIDIIYYLITRAHLGHKAKNYISIVLIISKFLNLSVVSAWKTSVGMQPIPFSMVLGKRSSHSIQNVKFYTWTAALENTQLFLTTW